MEIERNEWIQELFERSDLQELRMMTSFQVYAIRCMEGSFTQDVEQQ